MARNRVPKPEMPQIDAAACRSILSGLVENAAIGLAVAGADGTVAYVNPMLGTILDVDPATLVGASVDTLLGTAGRKHADWQDFRSGKAAGYAAEQLLRRPDGSGMRVRVTANIVAGGDFVGRQAALEGR